MSFSIRRDILTLFCVAFGLVLSNVGATAPQVELCYIPRQSSTNAMSALHAAFAMQLYSPQTLLKWNFSYISQNGNPTTIEQYDAIVNNGKHCHAFFGPGSSVSSTKISPTIRTAWLDYASTSTELSDKKEHPSFSRVIPSDAIGGVAMAAIMKHFSWKHANIICTDEAYGRSISKAFTSNVNATIEVSQCVQLSATKSDMLDILKTSYVQSDVKIIAVAMGTGSAYDFFVESAIELGMHKTHVFLLVEAACSGSLHWLNLPGALCTPFTTNTTRTTAFVEQYKNKPASLAADLRSAGINDSKIDPARTTIYGQFSHDAVMHTMLSFDRVYRTTGSLPLSDGNALIEIIRNSVTDGLSGRIALDSAGDRPYATVNILNAQPMNGTIKEVSVGTWTSDGIALHADIYWMDREFSSVPPSSTFTEAPVPSDTPEDSGSSSGLSTTGLVIIIVVVSICVFGAAALLIISTRSRGKATQQAEEHIEVSHVASNDALGQMFAVTPSRANGSISQFSDTRLPSMHMDGSQSTLMLDGERELYKCQQASTGNYTEGKLLGRGANASVYTALLKDGSSLAVKTINLSNNRFKEQMSSIRREVEILCKVRHPNIVKYYGVFEDVDNLRVKVFMELLPGGSLGSMVRNLAAPLPEQIAKCFIAQITLALACCHSQNVVHRDLKGDNILLDHDGGIRLADFGAAKVQEEQDSASQTIVGTPYFMSPESISEGICGAPADVWALGVVTAEVLNKGKLPWPQFDSAWGVLRHIQEKEILLPDFLSEEARDFILACTNRDHEQRVTASGLLTHPFIAVEVRRIESQVAQKMEASHRSTSAFENSGVIHNPLTTEKKETPSLTKSTNSTSSNLTKQPITEMNFEERNQLAKQGKLGYTLGECVGVGASGEVFTALLDNSGELVAVKKVVFVMNEKLESRLLAITNEIGIMKTLSHGNIVRYLFTQRPKDDASTLLIFMEYIAGGSVERTIKTFGALKEKTAASYAYQILEGLEYLHNNGIAHRDIKPGNALLTVDGRIKLSDFGAAKIVQGGTVHFSMVGTPNFMAPEVIMEQGGGKEADVWSFGCCVLHMITGKLPWTNVCGKNTLKVLSHISGEDPLVFPSNIPEQCLDLVKSCVRRNPSERPSVQELLLHPWFAQALEGSFSSSGHPTAELKKETKNESVL